MPLVTQLQARGKEVRALQTDFAKVKAAQATLKDKPDDPEANLAVGKFLCFVKGDWEKGLALLAKSSDPKVKQVAENDLLGSSEVKNLIELADGWWAIAEKQSIKGRVEDRAIALYVRALDKAVGIEKTKVEKRISQLNSKSAIYWISKEATYTLSAQYMHFSAKPELLDGKGGGYGTDAGDGFAFVAGGKDPSIIVDLRDAYELLKFEIVNRKLPSTYDRAKTLTIWTSDSNSGPWNKIWAAKDAVPQWNVELANFVPAKFVKIGLTEQKELHLYSVKIFGRKR